MSTFQRTATVLTIGLALLAGCGGGGGDSPTTEGGGGVPPASLRLDAFGGSASTISLGWTAVDGASGYTLERKSAGGTYAPVATLAAGTRHFIDEGLAPNTAYAYRLVAAGTAAPTQAEQTATTSAEAAVVTAVGAPAGALSAQSLGAAGGRVASADGQVVVDVPAGALAADTELQLQPTTNTAPDGIGAGLHLSVKGALARPLTLTLAYPETMATHADGLGVALQRGDGSWVSLPLTQIDKAARTVSVQLGAGGAGPASKQSAAASSAASVSLDFYVVRYLDFYLSPREASLKVGESRRLVPYAHTRGVIGRLCIPDEELGCIPLPLMGTQEIPFENSKAGFSRKWYVFAEEGGHASIGTVTPTGALGATYKAPADVPDPNPVVVSFVSVNTQTGRRLTLSSTITIKEPVWTGIVKGTLTVPGGDIGFSFSAEAVWTPVAGSGGSRFVANGTQSVGVINFTCFGTASPASAPLPPGALVIDSSVTPARYTLDVGSFWRTNIAASCPGHGSTSVGMDVPGRLVVEGTVSADGTAINGTTVQNGIAWDWALTSQL